MGKIRIHDPGRKKFGYGINIPDPQHFFSFTFVNKAMRNAAHCVLPDGDFSHVCEQAHRSRSCRQEERMSGSSSAVLRWAFAPSSFSYPEAWKMRKSPCMEVSDILHGLLEAFSEERRHRH
jgi:hypothetical protein